MATALDVISGSLKLLGIRVAESEIEAEEAQDGLKALNDMLSEWVNAKKIAMDFEPVDDVEDELYVDEGFIGAIKANLAVYIAPEYGRVITDALAFRAKNGLSAVRAAFPLNGSAYPDSLPVGSGNEHGNYSGNGDVPGNNTGNRFYPSNAAKKCS